MLVDSSNLNTALTVTGAIRQAAQATGTSFQYLLATAKVESGLNPQAGAATSSARGLFQFIDQTWLATLKQSGAALGYGQYAAAITKTASGHYEVADPSMRAQILKLRNDPTANAVMAGAFTQANASLLSEKLGRSPSEGELYIAHFLGAGGAARLISAAAGNPNASAASLFPVAARANSSIFYDRTTGAARSLAQVRDVLTARYDVAARSAPNVATLAQAAIQPSTGATIQTAAAMPAVHLVRTISIHPGSTTPTTPVAPVPVAATAAATPAATTAPDTAGMTSAAPAPAPARVASAQDNEIFHGLFSDPGRNTPVAAVVSQLWGVANTPAGAAGPPPGSMLGLFKDDGEDERGT
jgi:hypothetical protein